MKTLKTLETLSARLVEIQRINSAASVLSWDQETYMPAGGGAARADQIATLQGIAHQLVKGDMLLCRCRLCFGKQLRWNRSMQVLFRFFAGHETGAYTGNARKGSEKETASHDFSIGRAFGG